MTQLISDSLANAQAALINSAFADGALQLYAGDPATGALIAPCKLPIAPFHLTAAGQISLAGQWFGTAIAPGWITWAKFLGSTGAYMNVSVSGPGFGGQIILDRNEVVYGDVIEIVSFVYRAPTT